MKTALFALSSLAMLGAILHLLSQKPPAEMIRAQVTLALECEIDIRYFALKNIDTGDIIALKHGQAEFDILENTHLQVVLNPRTSQVNYEGKIFKARKTNFVIDSCYNSGSRRLQDIFSNMN